MTVINKNSPLPCYYQVYQYLRNNIERNVYQPGKQLPSERVLSEQLSVNRFTIRKATEKLILDGLVYPIRRKGYFVKPDRINYEIHKEASYSSYVQANNLAAKVKILEIHPVFADAEQCQLFGLENGEMLWSVYFLRYYNNIPGSLTRSYLPLKRMPELNVYLEKTKSLYKTLDDHYGIQPRRINSVCEVTFADQQEFRHLAVYNNSPLLQVTSLVVDQNGAPLEQCVSKFRSDIVKIQINM